MRGSSSEGCGLFVTGSSVALAATACTSSSENESCSEFGAALTASSTDIVNAIALLGSNPDEAMVELEKTRSSYNETRDGWASSADAGASSGEGVGGCAGFYHALRRTVYS